jgi:membrane fusion protein, multidrug efflux system
LIWKKHKTKKSPSDSQSHSESQTESGAKHGMLDQCAENPAVEKKFFLRVIIAGVMTLVIAVVIISIFEIRKTSHLKEDRSALSKEVGAGPRVQTTQVQKALPYRDITLIGEARPFFDVVIYARVSGYITTIHVDKGDHVKQGQVLAVIESPETDKAYLSALSNWYNLKRIADRSKVLVRRKLISQQEADGAFANADIAASTLETQRVLKSYEVIKAPFDGTIANRYVDVGALLANSTNGQSAAGAIFEVSQNDRLRIYAYPDQPDAVFIKTGTPAEITLNEKPEVKIPALVTRNSELLDTKTRKLLTEVDIDNTQRQIVAGSYVTVSLRLDEGNRLEIPVEALAIQGNNTVVSTVDKDNKIHYRPINVGENNGEVVRVVGGLNEGDVIALNVGTSLQEGQKIQGVLQEAGEVRVPHQGDVPHMMASPNPAVQPPILMLSKNAVPPLYKEYAEPVSEPYAPVKLPEPPKPKNQGQVPPLPTAQ